MGLTPGKRSAGSGFLGPPRHEPDHAPYHAAPFTSDGDHAAWSLSPIDDDVDGAVWESPWIDLGGEG